MKNNPKPQKETKSISHKDRTKYLYRTFIVALILIGGYIFYHIGLFTYFMALMISTPCDYNIIKSIDSNDGKYTAGVYDKSCGATSPYLTAVKISNNNSGKQREVYLEKGQNENIELSWDNYMLTIDNIHVSNAGDYVTTLDDIVIVYPEIK